jgi:hypothetical protein
VRAKVYSVWLFSPGTVKPRIKWLENEMAEVEKEAKKLLSHG